MKSEKKRLLVIDDEANMRHMLSSLLQKSGYIVDSAGDGYDGLEMLSNNDYDFVLCDIKMPRMGGMEFLRSAQNKLSTTTIIVMSAYGTIDMAIEAMKLGAYDYISKPFKADEVILTLKKAEERESLKSENIQLKEKIKNIEKSSNYENTIAKSKSMQNVLALVEKVAQYDTTVLILGESGTGKEIIARIIHNESKRAKMPLVPLNCGGIPENLLESELFGYIKGSFTGADRNKKGLFEEADLGTIFLDEIGELPLALQVKLLRVLQENEIRPIGASKTKKINVRVIAATAKNLSEEVKKGIFREDLFYRLNVLTISLPPLRKRPEDIPPLCKFFINRFNEKIGKQIFGISPASMSMLLNYSWPGNVRELENMIERAVVLCEGDMLLVDQFPVELTKNNPIERDDDIMHGFSLKNASKLLEKHMIKKALLATEGNRSKAAQLLEISHPSLLSKMKEYDILL